ncbi:SLC25A3 [Cordylochernes scorpioides]|uniref:SLC25A3 n=1 Tax=Cordylochernes scorpioides TaxID=51811 RepID=A0ABY6K5E8_9ARAC|nr:SLC25A3 [Cordylochernes scorpioides]
MVISEPKKAHLREVLLFAFNWKKSATEAHRMLEEVYGDPALSKSQCYRWFKKFQSGDFELDNEPRGKPPQKFEDAELQALLDEDSTQMQRNSRNNSSLGMTQKLSKWVPHELSERQQERRLVTCEGLLARHEKKSFLHRIVTSDEKWIHFSNPTRQKSWGLPGQFPKQMPRPNRFGKKAMLLRVVGPDRRSIFRAPETWRNEEDVVYGSMKYYMLCGLGGVLSCGITHTAVVPLDLVKCRIQTNPAKYKSIFNGFSVTVKEEGMRGLGKGWAPTAIGYSLQGLGKFGFYEVFKILYGNMLGDELSYTWRTSLYLAASASAEFFADIALCPMEACKVRIQTQPNCPPTLRQTLPLILKDEGVAGLYKGISPLWMRQIPYTMMKFACFERTVEALYQHVVPKPREECTKSEQLVVTFAAGYIAGVFCAIVSHPADTVVSKLNQEKGSTAIEAAKKLGMAGLWKGLTPRIIMIGTLTALQWFIYDAVKVALHLPRPPPPQMPDSLKKKLEEKQK